MKIRKCKPLTLIEVLVAFSLGALVIGILFTTYRHSTLIAINLEKGQQQVLAQQRLQQRLSQIFSKMIIGSWQVESTDNNCSIANFTFDNGIDHDQAYCNQVKGSLSFDKGSELILTVKPDRRKKEKTRKEVLLQNIEKLQWEAIRYPPQEPCEPPTSVKLHVDYKDGKEATFAFQLPNPLAQGIAVDIIGSKEET